MEKPKQTISAHDLQRKIDLIIAEAKRDLTHPGIKIVLGTAGTIFAALVLSYMAGKRKGKKQSRHPRSN